MNYPYPLELCNPKYFLFKHHPLKTISVRKNLIRIYDTSSILRFRTEVMQHRQTYFFVVWNFERVQCLSSSGKFYDLWIEYNKRRPYWLCDCTGFMNRKFCSHTDLLKYSLMKEEIFRSKVSVDNEHNMYYNYYRI